MESLSPLERALAEESLAWMAPYGDASCDLLSYPGAVGHYSSLNVETDKPHLIRESVWWATGLLLRNRGDDTARAERILTAVLRWQFDEPGTPYHGTFHRAPEEKVPTRAKCVMWADYDPNWRQFIPTSFCVIVERFSDRVSPELVSRLKASIRSAVEGEPPDRIVARYSNIAMMQAFQLVYAGTLFREAAWKARGLRLAREIFELFSEHETFAEFNSPTYYGVNLYALRLWRLESKCPELEAWGATMEEALWRHVARYYHAGLRNICGPYDRSYGMDMPKYASGIGMWMRLELEPQRAPAPSAFSDDFGHRHDFAMSPLIAILGAEIPADVRALLREVPTERRFRQVIETKPEARVATVYMKADRMWGAESGTKACQWDQHHLATAHWLQPDGTVGWMRLENEMSVDAVASEKGIRLTASNGAMPQRMIWHVSVNARPMIGPGEWRLPGMLVRTKTTLQGPTLAEGAHGVYLLVYELSPGQEAALELEFLPGRTEELFSASPVHIS